MGFEKRDIILIAGVLLFMVGLIPFMPPIYAIIIAIAIYFGIKVFVGRRKKSMAKEIGEGFCVECGEKIIEKKCPNCDMTSK
jgi:flagellar biosynthesis component FlhA